MKLQLYGCAKKKTLLYYSFTGINWRGGGGGLKRFLCTRRGCTTITWNGHSGPLEEGLIKLSCIEMGPCVLWSRAKRLQECLQASPTERTQDSPHNQRSRISPS